MAKNRIATRLALIVVAIGLLLTALAGIWTYTRATAPILHPDPQQTPSVSSSEPAQKWADAVQRGRQIMRAGLTRQNLPALSVAMVTSSGPRALATRQSRTRPL
jgi:hypothetical protein